MKSSIVGRILMALIFASVIGGLSAGPALGRDDNRGRGPKQQGRHDNRRWQADRGWRDHRVYRPYVYRPYRYRPEPIYAPPPVFYAPEPSPGISFFFPPIRIR